MINFPLYNPEGKPGDPYFYTNSLLIHGNGVNKSISTGTVIDSSTSANLISVVGTGTVTQGSVNPFGNYWSNYFNGSTDYLTVADSSSLRVGNSNFTVECWAYITGGSNSRAVVGKGSTSTGWSVLIDTTGYWAFTDTTTTQVGTILAKTNTWTHLALVRASNILYLYVNGVIAVSSATSTNFNQTNNLIVGADRDSSTKFTGYISNVRLVNGNAVYTSTFLPSLIPFTGTITNNTVLLTCSSNGIRDVSTNSSVVLSIGTPSVQRLSPWGAISQYQINLSASQGSIRFDGSTGYLYANSQTEYALGTNDFTIECWVNADSWTGTIVPFWQTDVLGSSTNNKLWFGYTLSRLTLGQYSTTNYVQTPWTPNIKTWYHLAVVRLNGVFYLYINGTNQLLSTNTISTSTSFGQNGITIGSTNGPYYLNGFISNFRVTNGTALYTVNFPPSAVELTTTTNTVLLTAHSSQLLFDKGINGFPISKIGKAQPTIKTPFSTSANTSTSAQIYSGSYYFDGNSYLTITNSAELQVNINNFTAEAWMYFSTLPANTGINNGIVILQKGSTDNNTFEWKLILYQTGGLYYLGFQYSQDGINVITVNSNSIIVNANSWNYFTLSKDNTTVYLFLDGTLIGSPTIFTYIYNGTGTVYVAYNPTGSIFFNGFLSNVRLINGTALYANRFIMPSVRLTPVNNTNLLLLGTNVSIHDSTMQNNLITTNDAKITTNQGKFNGSSLYFDGDNDYVKIPTNSNLFSFNSDFTIDFWLYSSTSTYYGHVFSTTLDYATANCIRVNAGNYNNILQVASGPDSLIDANISFSTSTWTHVAVVRTGTNLILYQDGIAVGSATDTRTFVCDTLVIGNVGGFGGPYSLNFSINDFRITHGYSRYSGTFTPPSASLVDFQIDPITLLSTTTSFTTATLFGTGTWAYNTVTMHWSLVNQVSPVPGDIPVSYVSDQTNTSTTFFSLPTGTTLQRPIFPSNGYMRFNTTLDVVEYYSQGVWVTLV